MLCERNIYNYELDDTHVFYINDKCLFIDFRGEHNAIIVNNESVSLCVSI